MVVLPMPGEEPVLTRDGRRWLWCFDTESGRQFYLDLGTDMAVPQDEAVRVMLGY